MKRISILTSCIVLTVLIYVLLFEFLWNKEYQKKCPLMSTVRPRVSGVTKVEAYPDKEYVVPNPEAYRDVRFRDSVDLVEYHGEREVFIMTNYILTINQTIGNCSENPAVVGSNCTTDADCPKNKRLGRYGYGITTGKCVQSTSRPKFKTCEVTAWCPTENWNLPLKEERAMFNVSEFIILPKTFVESPGCGPTDMRGYNIRKGDSRKYIQNCIYDPVDNPYCPNLRVKDIVEMAGSDMTKVSIKGGIFIIKLDWGGSVSLDFNYTLRDYIPKYSFRRGDIEGSKGYNFKSAIYNYNELNTRTHIHRFGLTFIIQVEGEARKFDFFQVVLTVGAVIGLLEGIFAFINFVPKTQKYVPWTWYQKVITYLEEETTWVTRSGLAEENKDKDQSECE